MKLCVQIIYTVFNNTDHPENHCITVINKVLKTFRIIVNDENEIKKNFNDTCTLLIEPISELFRAKYIEYQQEFGEFDFECLKKRTRYIITGIFKLKNSEEIQTIISKFLKEMTY